MKMILLVLVLVLVAALPVRVSAYASCDRAEAYGWHSRSDNIACYMDIMNDIIGGGGWEDF